jgi:hypothetical protein
MSRCYEKRIAELEARIAAKELTPESGHLNKHKKSVTPHAEKTHVTHHHGLLGDRVKLIGALDTRYHNFEKRKNTFMIHESKLGAIADINEWLRGYVTFSKHHGDDIELEEGYALLRLGESGVSFKPGKFFMEFGAENRQHFFERRMITFSAVHEGVFGHRPWADTGIQAKWELPFLEDSELSFAVVDGDNAQVFGDGRDEIQNNNFPIAVNLTSGIDTPAGFFRAGQSFSAGKWDRNDKYQVYLAGGDLYYKNGNFDAQTEILYRFKENAPSSEDDVYGYYAWGAYTFPIDQQYLKSIELLLGFGQFIPSSGNCQVRISPQICFTFNEYAKFRTLYQIRKRYPDDNDDNRFISQFALAF